MPTPAEPEPERPPVIYRCERCNRTHPRPYRPTLPEPQPCPHCAELAAYSWEWDGNRWNTLLWGKR